MNPAPFPASPVEKNPILFTVYCPALQKDVILFTETWERHIMAHKTGPGFSYLRSKIPLLQRAISSAQDTGCFIRMSDYLKSEWSMDYACPDFRPGADFLRIAFKRLDDGTIIVTSAYKVTRGILKYEP